jgi:hypothetical protein
MNGRASPLVLSRPLPTPMQPWVAGPLADHGRVAGALAGQQGLADLQALLGPGTHELGSLAPLGKGVSHVTSHG